MLQTCAWSSSAACVSNPGDWCSKCVRPAVCGFPAVSKIAAVAKSCASVQILGNYSVFLVGASYLRGPQSVLIGPGEGTVRSCCRQ